MEKIGSSAAPIAVTDAREHLPCREQTRQQREVDVAMPVSSLSAELSPRDRSTSPNKTRSFGSRLNTRRQSSFGRHPLADTNTDRLTTAQAAAAFHAAFKLDRRSGPEL